ncbi:MAG: hypothetical protein D6748_14450 [Calditrichaeota bacterium]|nr:MAG: hypothetical protein D6748_14450 [Calditrichota bacterium]
MKRPVNIDMIIEAFEFVSGETEVYLNTRTGEIFTIPGQVRPTSELEELDEDFRELQEEIQEKAQEELSSDEYILLPNFLEIDEYRIMEEFCLTLEDEQLSMVMCGAIQGKGAFKRFQENIYRYGLADRWYRFRENVLRERAIKWCEDQGIPYVDRRSTPV